MMARPCLPIVLAALIASEPAMAAQRAYVRAPTVPAATMDADRDACIKAALAYVNGPGSPSPPPRDATTAQAVAHAFDLRGPKLAAAYEVQCMADRGYTALPLTGPEQKELGRARDAAARDRWYDAFASSDLSVRIAAAAHP